jgi:hypothetical protein
VSDPQQPISQPDPIPQPAPEPAPEPAPPAPQSDSNLKDPARCLEYAGGVLELGNGPVWHRAMAIYDPTALSNFKLNGVKFQTDRLLPAHSI